jgi:hypothetical protein
MDSPSDLTEPVSNPLPLVETIGESVHNIWELLFAGFDETTSTDEDDYPQFV